MTVNSRAIGTVALLACSLTAGCSGSGTNIFDPADFAGYSAGASQDQLSASTPGAPAGARRTAYLPVQSLMQSEAAAAGEHPGQSDAFVDAYGVDSHFGAEASAEYKNFGASSRALYDSGIRHIRDGSANGSKTINELAAHGIRHSIGFAIKGLTAQTITNSLNPIYGSIDFVEAQNEYDNSGDPNWPAHLRAEQALIYKTVNANSRFKNIAVLAPALDNPKNASVLGNVPADFSNLHNGTCDFEPSTTERSIEMSTQQKEIQAEALGKPTWTTETGYDDDTRSSCSISEDGAAKYIPRTLAYRWNAGMPHVYFDNWSDENAAHFAVMGLVTQNGTPKKQYYAVQSLLALLSDRGPSFATKPLQYTASGSTGNVRHTLLQKRNGTYEMLLWIEVPSWDHVRKVPISVKPQTIKLSFAAKPSGVEYFEYGSNWSFNSSGVSTSGSTITLNVTDSISVLSFKN